MLIYFHDVARRLVRNILNIFPAYGHNVFFFFFFFAQTHNTVSFVYAHLFYLLPGHDRPEGQGEYANETLCQKLTLPTDLRHDAGISSIIRGYNAKRRKPYTHLYFGETVHRGKHDGKWRRNTSETIAIKL